MTVQGNIDASSGDKGGRAPAMAGATMPLDDLSYPTMYQHSQQLGKLCRWDGRGLFVTIGMLGLGGAIGGLAAGFAIRDAGVLASLIGGLAFIVGAQFIRRASIVSARDLKVSFDQTLTMYERVPAIREMREHFDSQTPAPPTGLNVVWRFFFP